MTPRLALLLTALLPLAAQAQVPTSSSPTATRSTNSVNPPPVAPQAPPQPANPALPVQVPRQPAQPIRSTGPAQVAPASTPATRAPDKVYDRNGRIVPGVRPAGANRVFDSRTGRYYDSVPAGDGQQIKP